MGNGTVVDATWCNYSRNNVQVAFNSSPFCQACQWNRLAQCCARIRAQAVGIYPSRGRLRRWILLWRYQVSPRSKNEFPRCFQIVFFPLFSSSFWSVVLWPTLTCWYCQAKGLQELLAEARAATADLQVLCYTLCIFIYLYGYIFTYYLGIQWPLQVKFKTTVAEHEETMRRQLQDRVESCRNWRARIGKTTWQWTNEDHNKNLDYLHLSSTA